jgi:hypothetical protein
LSTGFILDKVNLLVSGGGGGEVDKEAPVVSASENGNSGIITFSAMATDNKGVIKVEFYVDNILNGKDETSPYSITMDSKILSNTSHTLVAKAYDAAGNVGTSIPVTFIVNNPDVEREPPVISVSESGASGTITFNAIASDNIGVIKVEFYVDNILKGTDTAAPFSMNLDSQTLAEGSHTLVGKAYDAAGNIGISPSVPFIISIAPAPATTYNEVESNGSTRIANIIADAVTKIVGYIGASTDQDYFKINVAAGRTVTVNMTGPARDYDLFLLGSSGITLKTGANPGSTESVIYKNTGAATATYYIKVVGFGGAYTASTPYSLVLSR